MKTNHKVLKFINVCIYIINILVIVFAARCIDQTITQREQLITTIETNERTKMNSSLEVLQSDINYYTQFIDITKDKAIETLVDEWSSKMPANIRTDKDSDKTYLVAVDNTNVLWEQGQINIDLSKLRFENNEKAYTLTELVHTFKNSYEVSKVTTIDENGKEYWAEWVYCPSSAFDINGHTYVNNGEIKDSDGLFILALKSKDRILSDYSGNISLMEDNIGCIVATSTLCLTSSIIYLLGSIFYMRYTDFNIKLKEIEAENEEK